MYNITKIMVYIMAGFLGGIIRGLVGFVKNKTIEKADYFKLQYFLVTILISGIVRSGSRSVSRYRVASFIFSWLRWNRFY